MAKQSVIGRLMRLLTGDTKSRRSSRRSTSKITSKRSSKKSVKKHIKTAGKTPKQKGGKGTGSPVGGKPIVKRILEEGQHCFDLVFSGDPLRRSKVELIHRGDSWLTPYLNVPAVTILSDGNGLNVTYRGSDEINNIRMEYHEAFDLAVALLEYTKSDPNMPNPPYEVI